MKPNTKLAALLSVGAVVLAVSLVRLFGGQASLRIVPANPPLKSDSSAGSAYQLQLQGGSNGAIYMIQSSTNLTDWRTILSVKTMSSNVVPIGAIAATSQAGFYRVREKGPGTDTNAPTWTNGVGGQVTYTPPSSFGVSWNSAGDDVGVAAYAIYLNGVLVTNVLGTTLSYPFVWNSHQAADLRIQAFDASSNATPILPLAYLPGDKILAVSDDSARVYFFDFVETNTFQTNAGFSARKQIATLNGGERGLAIGDFNRDGILDIIAGGASGDTLTPFFLKGNGGGTFAPPVPQPTSPGAGGYMMDCAVGDFDGDGNLDFVANGNTDWTMFYWGNGDGTFTVERKSWGSPGRGMVAGDFNEDGREDIARMRYGDGQLKVFLSNGDRTFIETNIIASGLGNNDPYALAGGDFDEDGHLDLIVAGGGSGDVAFFKGLGNGSLTNITGTNGLWANLDINYYSAMDAYDYNSDGHLDMVMATGSGQVFYWAGLGDGTFSTNRVTVTTGISGAFGISAPPRPPRVDVNISPADPVVNLNETNVLTAVGSGVKAGDFFRWTFGDQGTNPVAWTFGTNASNLGQTVSHVYTNEGRFLARLWHTAAAGVQSVRGAWVTVKGAAPVANPGGPYLFGEQAATQAVWYATLDGSASTDDFGIVSYIWDFGDGTGATNSGSKASHGWTNAGVWNVTLTVVDASRQTNTKGTTVTFTNGAPPVAAINGPDTLDETHAKNGVWTATFYGTNSTDDRGIWKYDWTNSATGQKGTGPSFVATWNAVGTNLIVLTVTDHANQTNTTTHTVVVTQSAPPVAVINGPDVIDETSAHNGVWTATFYATNSTDDFGIWKYVWNFGNGTTGSGASPVASYTAVGTNVITLTVYDNAGQTNITTHPVIVKANALPQPVIQGPHVLSVDVATNGLWYGAWNGTNSTDDTGIYVYSWTFGDGATASGPLVTHSYGGQGVYPMTLRVTDNGNQSVTITQSIVVVAGNPPVARITASTLTPEGSQPVVLSAANSTSDNGIYQYFWSLPLTEFGFDGQVIDSNQWVVANTVQSNKFIVTGKGQWGVSYFFANGSQVPRGSAIEGRVDTPSTSDSHAMVGLRDLNLSSGNYSHLEYAIYFANGSVNIYELGSNRGKQMSYSKGTSYDFRIETKSGAGARYFLRPSGTGQPFALIFESSNNSDASFGYGADVHNGVFGFDSLQVQPGLTHRDVTTPVYPGGTVTLTVVDNALLTNSTSIVITPVTGVPPVAVINGPTNGLAGVEIPFSGYNSSDDYAIASYTWNFGDGTASAFGPAVSHAYGTSGTYTNTLTVLDYANQSSSASLVVTITGSNALLHVPWLIINGIEQPHEIYSGKTNTLKAVAQGIPVPFTNIWTYGDGSGSVTNVVTNAAPASIYNLEASHAYTGGDGTPYYATVQVLLTNGAVLSDTYPLLLLPKTLDREMKVAIDEGLWYLQKTENRYDFDANTKGGDWASGGAKVNGTASGVQSFAVNGHLMTDDASRDPYVDTVRRGVNFLLNHLSAVAIGPQVYGDPDGNQNGIGLTSDGSPIYETGPVMDAFVAAARPELIAPAGGANVKGRPFKDIVQDMVDMYAFGQSDYSGANAIYGGGWRYSWNADSDNSACQWAAIGMFAAEHFWGCIVPDWVKQRNLVWLQYSSNGNGFGYGGPGEGIATTPSGLVQLAFDGITTTNALWIMGENYMAKNWSSGVNYVGANNIYANYAVAKSLRTAVPQPVHNFALTGKDWFRDPVNGMARFTIDRQRPDGAWTDNAYVGTGPHATAWSVLILTSSLFQQGPVAVINVQPNPTAIGYPTIFDARTSYHRHPSYMIVEYRWIFDSSKGVDFDHPDAIGPVVTNVFGALSTNIVSLQVRDNGTPQLNDTASVEVRTTVPPYPPTADAGGPYVACAGQDVHLDGSGSFCVDAISGGNFIQSYDWEVYYEVPVTFNQGVSGIKAVVTNGYLTAGSYQIGLRVKNANSIVYPGFGLPDVTSDAFTTVFVYNRVIPDLRVRPKATKAQLTWTKVGDYAVVMRSPLGPDRGFVQVGQTDSSYATFLDETIDYNTDYYYRVYAYRTGQAVPLGVSDPIFIHSLPRNFDEHAPSFRSVPVRVAKVGQLYEVTLDAVDPENKPLSFSLLLGPTNMTVNATSGVVDFTPLPSQVGNQFLSFQVTNSVGRDVQSYTLFVFPATNHAPVAQVNGPYAALIGQDIQFSSAGTSDADGNKLLYYWNFGDGTTSTNPNPVHAYAGIGDYLVTLFVNDGYGGTDSAKTHTVITRPNRPPTAVVSKGPSFTVRLGETLNLDGSGSYDLDGDPMTFTWTWGDGSSNTVGTNIASHSYAATGTFSGSLTVADNRGGAGVYNFTVTAGPANRLPVIAFTVSTNTPFVMSIVTFDATGTTDPDGDPMTFAWDFGDRSKTTGPLVTHVFKQISDFTVTLTVSDNHGGTSVATQLVHAVNAPPVFTSNPPLLTRAGTNYIYTPTITDADGDPATFQLIQGPTTMSCDTNTGTLTWLPGTNNLGPNAVVLRATDTNGATGDQSFTLVVTTPLGPQLDLLPTHIEMTNVAVDAQSLALSGTVKVFVHNNGTDPVPIPFTVSVFVDGDSDGTYSTNADTVVGYGVVPAGFVVGGGGGIIEMTVNGKALFKDSPLYAFVDSENVVPEYNKLNNIMRSGADAATNQPPVVDLSASLLVVDRTTLPAHAVLTARLGNSGLVSVPTNVPMAFYDGDPKAGGVLIGVASSTVAMVPGTYQDLSVIWASPTISAHTIYVVADDSGYGTNLFQEITLANNTFSELVDLSVVLSPVADAGPDQNILLGDTAVLNGRGSTDPQGKPLTYRWAFRSIPISSHTQLIGANTVSPSFLADAAGPFTLQLVVNDGLLDSTNSALVHVTVVDTNVNYPPNITSTPSFQGMVSVRYTYPVKATDPQNKPLTFRLNQAPAGMTINTTNGLVQWMPTNAGSFFLQVAVDGVGGSAYQGYSLTILPYRQLPPQFTSTPVGTAVTNAPYGYTAVAVDPNGDTVTYGLSQKPSGMTINAQTGVVTWTPIGSQLGGNRVTVTASDGSNTVAQSYNLVVLTAGTNGPVVQPIPDQTVTAPAAFATIPLDSFVTDPKYPANQMTWLVSGTNLLQVAIDSNRVATITYPGGVNVAEQITFLAIDPDGKSGYSAPLLTVIGNATPPVAAISNLDPNNTTSIQTGTFELKGTADDPGVPVPVVWRIGLYNNSGARIADVTPGPVDAAGYHEGRVPAGGSFGMLDFTLVRNGSYTLLLEVDANGQVATATAAIAIDTPVKLGQLKFAQQDLVLPVQGVGMQVNRTYDSLNLAAADFGYSWTYSVSDLETTVGDQRVNTQDGFDSTTFSLRTGGSWDVTLTMPDSGRIVTFRFSLGGGGIFRQQAYWTPPAWVKASLVPTCSSTLITLPGGIPPFWQIAGMDTDWQAFDWPGFVLTLQNGTKYIISREDLGEHFYASDSGFGGFVHAYGTPYLSSIIKPDGSHSDFIHNGTAAGLNNIVQFDGANRKVKSILFQRDSQGRIASIFTPDHLDTNGVPNGPAAVTYAYDSIGNLVAVAKLQDSSNPTNPVYATYQYSYTSLYFPHLLTQIKDPRGIIVLQAVFDSAGRLIGTRDAHGNLASIQDNPGARTVTAFDRMGNPTQIGYDPQGNIISRTDPLGNTTTYAYDANNNRTSVTDPLGHTTRYAYDASGNPSQITDALGNTSSLTYSAAGIPNSYTDPLGHTTTNVLDAAGNPTRSVDPLGNVSVMNYDAAGNMTDLIDPNGHTTAHLVYASGGGFAQIANVAGQTTTLGYDASGHVTSHQSKWINPANSNDVRTVTSYVGIDYAGRVTNRIDALGHSTSRVYDQLNDVIQTTDFRGNSVSNSYDADGNLIESRDSTGLVTRTVYDANDRPVLQVDIHLDGKNADGTQLIYDAAGRLISTIRLSNVVVQVSSTTVGGATALQSSFVSSGGVISSNFVVYDAAGRQIAVTDPAGQTTRYEYDAVGNKTAIIDPLGNRTTMEYDAARHNTAIRDALGNETDFLYDADGRLIRTVFQNGATASATYTATGQPDTKTDQQGNVRKVTYDSLGVGNGMVLPQITDPENGNALTNPVFTLAFDVNRNVQQMVDPKGRVTSFGYDQLNRRTSRTLPLGQVEQTAYDAVGDVSRVTDFNGQVAELQYDGLGRITTRKLYPAGTNTPSETATLQYDELGRVVEIDEPRGSTRTSYDLENRVTQVAAPEGTINYAYDPATGRMTRTWTANSDTSYAFDALGRLQTVTAAKRNGVVLNTPEVTTYAYTPVGNRASVTLPNGIKTLYGYDNVNRLTSLQHVGTNGAVLMSFAYQYNAMNLRTGATEVVQGPAGLYHTNSVGYTYDSLGRLVSETAKDLGDGTGYQAQYTYDLVGNRLKRALTTAGKTLTTYYAYDANDRLLTESNVVSTASSGGASFRPTIPGTGGRPIPSFDPQVARLSYYAIRGLPYGLLAAFLLPVATLLVRRRNRPAVVTLDLNAHRALFPRCITGLLAAAMFLIGFDGRVLANQAVFYAVLTTDTWGLDGSVTTYQYDANGSVLQKVTTGPKPETDTFQYTLLKQLAVSTRTYTDVGSQVVETTRNTYNFSGIRVRSDYASTVNGAPQSARTNYFLIDSFNRTGFAQVLEELPSVGATPSVSYTMGDDIIAQGTDPAGSAQYLLRDGCNSTRQLVSSLGGITDYYGYDAYGLMLGGNPTSANPSATKMLYTGEQFDSNLGQYNLRARFYDPGTGRFSTMDTYEGSPQDPRSLHKYAYCSNDPVNYHDPSGHQDLVQIVCAIGILGTLIGITMGSLNAWRGGSFSPDSTMFGISLSISGQVNGAFAVTAANIVSSALGGAAANGGVFAADVAGLAAGGFANFARPAGLGIGASFNVGTEALYTTGDNAMSTWTYFGPGISQSGGFTSQLAASVNIYGGVCWAVPKWDSYSGGFISLSMGAGSAIFGFAVTMFWSDSIPAQNGYNVGLTIAIPPGGPGVSSSFGLSYVDYKGSYAGPWDQASYALSVLALVPGMQIWIPFLGYKWAKHIG